MGRFVSIWFRYLETDWLTVRKPELKDIPFVLATPERGRMIVKAANKHAVKQGVHPGSVVADARAILPSLQVFDHQQELAEKLLTAIANWCIRFTPVAAIDMPGGLFIDASGCAHLWNGEVNYLKDITTRLKDKGYTVRAAIADTPGGAWAIARHGRITPIIETGKLIESLMPLPSAALRLETEIIQKLDKLGLYQVHQFMNMPRAVLRRRFGPTLLHRIDQAFGSAKELIEPVQPIPVYQQRLPCLEPISTAIGIEIALKRLLTDLCTRLSKEEKGIRKLLFKGYRVDGKIEQVEIGTNRPSRNIPHLFKLFEQKIDSIEPDLGIELFILESPVVEDLPAAQEAIWHTGSGYDEMMIAELLDRVAGKIGVQSINRYLPAEHSWPERSIVKATSLQEKPKIAWRTDLPRPVQLFNKPELITVMVPLPDYPPIQFIYRKQLYKVTKADGPERIEREWWLESGLFRDYYYVEVESGARYWIFRSGHYDSTRPEWFIHGLFA